MKNNSQISRRHLIQTAALAGAAVSLALPARVGFAQQKTIKLGWVRSTANLMASIAPEMGAAQGVQIESFNFNNAQDILTALTGAQLDIGLLTPIHLIRAVATGVDVVQIAGNTRGNTGIVAASALNIGKDDWEGLKKAAKGRRLKLGTSRGSINEILGIASLKKHGIDPATDLDVLNISNFAQHPQALRSGEIDLVITLEPLVAMMVGQGTGTLLTYPYDTEAGDLNTNYVATRSLVDDDPDRAQAFVKSLVAASKELADPAKELSVAKKLTGLDEAILKAALANCEYDLRNNFEKTVALSKMYFEMGYIKKDVSSQLRASIDDRFIESAGIED